MQRVATCITGLQRSLLEPPVVDTYHSRVRVPLEARGMIVDALLVVVVKDDLNGSHARLRDAIGTAFSPRVATLSLVGESEQWARSTSARCPLRTNSTWANPRGDASVLLQWMAVGRCFGVAEEVSATEFQPAPLLQPA